MLGFWNDTTGGCNEYFYGTLVLNGEASTFTATDCNGNSTVGSTPAYTNSDNRGVIERALTYTRFTNILHSNAEGGIAINLGSDISYLSTLSTRWVPVFGERASINTLPLPSIGESKTFLFFIGSYEQVTVTMTNGTQGSDVSYRFIDPNTGGLLYAERFTSYEEGKDVRINTNRIVNNVILVEMTRNTSSLVNAGVRIRP